MKSKSEEFEKALTRYVKAFGWGATIKAVQAAFVEFGFTLADTVSLDDGATRYTYTHPNGSTAMITEVINDQPNRDSNQHEE